jgi:hypothetical protein
MTGNAAWKWACSKHIHHENAARICSNDMNISADIQHGHEACTCCTDMHQRHAGWRSNFDMQLGHAATHLGHAARTCSKDMQQGHAAWICSMDMQY